MKSLAAMLSILVLFGGATTTAKANLPYKVNRSSLRAQERTQKLNYMHVLYVCRHGKGKPKRWACKARSWVRREWQETYKKLHPVLPPHYKQWLCLHSYEGAWNSNTGNGYYGGLQFMDSTWTRNGGLKYARYAYSATPLQQMWIAESAWHESGGSFRQWGTASMCGLS